MNIHELSTYNLSDAIKFHNRLNPRLWDQDEQLKPEVRAKLLEIAADFQEFLGIGDLEVKDITLSGSNAAYSYTPHSDIDLHLVVQQPQQNDEVYQELFNAKKYQYNDMHNIRIKGADVELYVQPADQTHVSLGVYSVLNDQWIDVPRRKRAKIDHAIVQHKYEDIRARIESALAAGDGARIDALATKIKDMRQAGLDAHGEFGPENLAFKMLRTQGLIKQLWDAKAAAKDQALSLKERERQSAAQPVTYGFKEDVGMTPDGVDPTTCMFLNEAQDVESIVMEFIHDVAGKLHIDHMPELQLHTDPDWSTGNHSFGRYEPETHTLHVSLPNRHILDVLRTAAHELCHCKQHELSPLPDEAGRTGSEWENEAHAVAGIFMRNFADAHPEYFDDEPLKENAAGYIPTKAQARDPRFKTALTVDIKPGEVGRQANKMSLQTDRQGRPALLMKTVNLRESQIAERLRNELAQLKDTPTSVMNPLNQAPTGPETPPKMPAGTIKVDVSDMYDWYKLGQKISDLNSIKQDELGQGPPNTVFAFGSEELENMYSHQLTNLGLKTHDLDEPGEEDVDESVTEQVLDELKIDNRHGIGQVPFNQDIDYFGLKVSMTPRMFLDLALPLDVTNEKEAKTIQWIEQHLDEPGIGAPFLEIKIPLEWEDGQVEKPAQVDGHDGRHRMVAILNQEGNHPVEVHLLPRGGLRRRDITPEWIARLRQSIVGQRGNLIRGPIFGEAV